MEIFSSKYAWLTGFIGFVFTTVLGIIKMREFLIARASARYKFNIDLYSSTISFKYDECFNILSERETDYTDILKVLKLSSRIIDFQNKGNKFKGCCVRRKFKKLYQAARKLSEVTGTEFGEKLHEGYYEEHEIHAEMVFYTENAKLFDNLKREFKNFYRKINQGNL